MNEPRCQTEGKEGPGTEIEGASRQARGWFGAVRGGRLRDLSYVSDGQCCEVRSPCVLPAAFSGRVDSPRQLPPGGTCSPMLGYLTHVEASGVVRLCGVLFEEKTETLLKPRVPCCRGHLYNRRTLKNPRFRSYQHCNYEVSYSLRN